LASSLSVTGLDAGYGAVRVLEDVSLSVEPGQTLVLLGTNGNGKSTLMKCVMGIVPSAAGTIVAEIDGERHDLVGRSTEAIVDLGISLVPEGRRLFPKLTVEETCCWALSARLPAPRSHTISTPPTKPSRCCGSGGANWPAASAAASSRCWPWRAR
jgi:branched-chain amino acid transport system ATP-binding protein